MNLIIPYRSLPVHIIPDQDVIDRMILNAQRRNTSIRCPKLEAESILQPLRAASGQLRGRQDGRYLQRQTRQTTVVTTEIMVIIRGPR